MKCISSKAIFVLLNVLIIVSTSEIKPFLRLNSEGPAKPTTSHAGGAHAGAKGKGVHHFKNSTNVTYPDNTTHEVDIDFAKLDFNAVDFSKVKGHNQVDHIENEVNQVYRNLCGSYKLILQSVFEVMIDQEHIIKKVEKVSNSGDSKQVLIQEYKSLVNELNSISASLMRLEDVVRILRTASCKYAKITHTNWELAVSRSKIVSENIKGGASHNGITLNLISMH